MNVYEKLLAVQQQLKAPKEQYNSFGKYKYRSCEDILESIKPLQGEVKVTTLLSDEVFELNGRYYVKATATFIDCEKPEDRISVSASAREEENKKGMDGSQVTGASSSYARKYALNGLFNIDDTKDSDKTNDGNKYDKTDSTDKEIKEVKADSVPSQSTRSSEINDLCILYNRDKKLVGAMIKSYGVKTVDELTVPFYEEVANRIKENKL